MACRKHLDMLLSFARQQLRGREADADDFVQEAMTRFLETFKDGPPPGRRADAWLMSTLNNHLVSDWRKRDVRERAQSDPGLRLVAGPQPVPGPEPFTSIPKLTTALEEVTDEEFEAAVRSLTPKLRAAYELHVQGLSHTEIAGRLGITENNVAKRLFDARKRLRARLARPRWGERS